MTTRIRSLAFLVVVAAAIVTVAPPAGAATTSINGVVLAPVGTWRDVSTSADYDLHGVVVDGTLGVASISFYVSHFFFNTPFVLTTLDGSEIRGYAGDSDGTPFVRGLAGTGTEQLLVTGGTGRFQGASGQGSFEMVNLQPVHQLGSFLPLPVAPARVGNLTLQVTTP